MAKTRTGSFPIGFRRGGGAWQKDLNAIIRFAQDNGFEAVDTGLLPVAELQQLIDADLRPGSVDLPQPWSELASADAAKRHDAVQRCSDYIHQAAPLGVSNFFVVILPEDPAMQRKDNLALAVEGYGQLCAAIEDTPARIVIEGWPGPAPHVPALGCTPADLRLLFERIGSDRLGINYDPSHLVRMGIDPVRFAGEFAPRIGHAHAKDTELYADALYEHGNLQPATEAKPHRHGGQCWRYAIPGQGVVPWLQVLTVLADSGYEGMLCIELEDENFAGSDEREQQGLLASRDYLVNV